MRSVRSLRRPIARAPQSDRRPLSAALRGLGWAGGILVLGVGIAFANILVLAALLAAGLVVFQFRRGVSGLETVLIAMPLTGIISVAAFPRSYLGLAANDVLLVLPLFVYIILRRLEYGIPLPSRFPWTLLLGVTGIVSVQFLNPNGGSILVRLIGFKTWLFYTPFVICAYDYCSTRDRVHRLFKVVCVAGVPSILIGLWEAVQIARGHSDAVYSYYGNAASAVSQGFAQLQVTGGGVIRRVPSTFTFGAQYYVFTLVMLASSMAWFRLSGGRRERGVAGILTGLVALAATTSGVREALIGVPGILLLDLLFSKRRHIASVIKLVGSGATGLIALAAVAGSTAFALLSHLGTTAIKEYDVVVVQGFKGAFRLTVVGLGVGADTNAARYALPGHSVTKSLFAQGFESWYVKVQLELGLIGLILVLAFLVSLIVRLRRALWATTDAALAGVGSVLLALVGSVIVQNLKGQYIDLNPMALFFWVVVGVLLRLPTLADDNAL